MQSVEYADAHTRSEERLRNSEADCAALWEEREEAKERLCAAFVEGRALEERLDEAVADTMQLRQALEETEARLAAAAKEAEEAGSELGASRGEVSGMKTELEAMADRCGIMSWIRRRFDFVLLLLVVLLCIVLYVGPMYRDKIGSESGNMIGVCRLCSCFGTERTIRFVFGWVK